MKLADGLSEEGIHQKLLDQLWRGLLLLAVLGAPASLSRIQVTGWQKLYLLHMALALLIVGISVGRRHLSARFKAGMAIAVPAAVGFGGLVTFGFYSAGLVWIAISCLIAAICASRAVMRWVWAAELLGLAGVAIAFSSGMLKLPLDANHYITEPVAWLGALTGTVASVYTLVSAIRVYNLSILGLLNTIRAQAKLIEHQATHDALTGVPTLRLALDRLDMAAHQARRQDGKLALLYLDLDGFKQINDRQGHAAGDQVLKVVTSRMRERLRGADTLARIGGDEFIVIASDIPDRAAALALAQSLVACCDKPIEHQGEPLCVGVSIGLALFPDDADDLVLLRQRADQAMYRVKRRGKRGVCSSSELETGAAAQA